MAAQSRRGRSRLELEDEVASDLFTVKTFATGEQAKVPREGLVEFLKPQAGEKFVQ